MSRIVRSSKRLVTVVLGGGPNAKRAICQWQNGFTLLRVHKSRQVSDSRAVYTPFTGPPPLLHLRSSCERVRGSFDFSSRADRLCEGTATRRCCLPLFNSDNNANTPRACNEHPTMLSIDHWSAEEGSEIRCLGQREEETDRRFFPSVERRMEILRPL